MTTSSDRKISIASKPENINLVERLVDEVKDIYNIREDAYGNILVAVSEAVNNAICHGNKANPLKNVDIGYIWKEDLLAFVISDEGEGFDHYNIPDPTAPENIEKPTGRGVFLMKQLSDNVIFSDNGRTVELYFKISGN